MIRDWWKRFGRIVAAPVGSTQDDVEHCTVCGQPFNIRDLHEVVPHFGHQLGLDSCRNQETSAVEGVRPCNVVRFRRPATFRSLAP